MENSIYKTLAYFDIFDYPLTPDELRRYLWRDSLNDKALELQLSNSADIEGKEEYFFLKGRGEIVAYRKKRKILAEKLWKKTRFYVGLLRMIPFIKMVAICNNLAFDNPEEGSDIDLFIIIKKKRLWMTRLMITTLFQILGVRRQGRKIAGRFCLSFFLTEEAWNLKNIALQPYDVYLVYWLATLRPILNDGIYLQFMRANEELCSTYLPNFQYQENKRYIVDNSTLLSFINRFLTFLLDGRFGDWIEKKARSWLKPRAEKKLRKLRDPSGVIINDRMLKFHNIDRREEYCREWNERMRLKKSSLSF